MLSLVAACATQKAPGGAPGEQAAAPPGAVAGFVPQAELKLCKGMTVSNAPATDGERRIRSYAPFARVNGVSLLISPAPGACLSSAFGTRRGKLHKGIDLQSRPAGAVVAAGSGRVVESGYRSDYGNYVLIDHGGDVFTRYAHLRSITGAAKAGRAVSLGTELGVMGNTAGYQIPVHLHYEVLTGNYATPKAAFGLTPVDILRHMDKKASA